MYICQTWTGWVPILPYSEGFDVLVRRMGPILQKVLHGSEDYWGWLKVDNEIETSCHS